MANNGFEFDAFKEWVRSVGIVQQDFDYFLKEFLLQQAEDAVADAKENTPVDTGALRAAYQIGGQEIALAYSIDEQGKEHFDVDDSLSQKATVDNVGDDNTVVINNPMEYASYIEYGHRSYPPQYMLTNAVDRINRAMPTRFERQFRDFLIKRGMDK